MDFSWLGDLFNSFLGLFNPLKGIKHWKLWAELFKIYRHLKSGIDWYKEHVIKRMKALSRLNHELFDRFIKPALRIVDTIRRLSGIVGLFNKRLASRLNTMFLRVETYLLLPFNLLQARINSYARIFQSFLTPLGYFDRATLLNSFWRDFTLLRQLLFDPNFSGVLPIATLPLPDFKEGFAPLGQYLSRAQNPLQPDVDASIGKILSSLGIPQG